MIVNFSDPEEKSLLNRYKEEENETHKGGNHELHGLRRSEVAHRF